VTVESGVARVGAALVARTAIEPHLGDGPAGAPLPAGSLRELHRLADSAIASPRHGDRQDACQI
jgi:hypothetical protein